MSSLRVGDESQLDLLSVSQRDPKVLHLRNLETSL